MSLDVPTPEPPELSEIDPNEYEDAEIVGETDYRREEIARLFEAGAWEEAFGEWASQTDLDDADFAIVTELKLLQQFDFFWDSFAERVGYHAPGIPEDWRERELHPELDSWGTASGINAELAQLGQIVCDVLKDEYIDWETDYEAPDDLPDFE